MRGQEIRFREQYEAPPEQVFALFANHERFGKLLGVPVKRVMDAPHDDDPNGVGSVRRIASGFAAFEETILTCEPPKLIEYTVSRGGPIKNHHGRLEFSAAANGDTQLAYTIRFTARVPLTGSAIALALDQLIGRALKRVPRHL